MQLFLFIRVVLQPAFIIYEKSLDSAFLSFLFSAHTCEIGYTQHRWNIHTFTYSLQESCICLLIAITWEKFCIIRLSQPFVYTRNSFDLKAKRLIMVGGQIPRWFIFPNMRRLRRSGELWWHCCAIVKCQIYCHKIQKFCFVYLF